MSISLLLIIVYFYNLNTNIYIYFLHKKRIKIVHLNQRSATNEETWLNLSPWSKQSQLMWLLLHRCTLRSSYWSTVEYASPWGAGNIQKHFTYALLIQQMRQSKRTPVEVKVEGTHIYERRRIHSLKHRLFIHRFQGMKKATSWNAGE